jgi:hypothetical protein
MIRFDPRLACAAALLLLATSACAASAQTAAPGSRVRIVPLSDALPTEGFLVAMTPDTVSVHVGLSSTMQSVPMDSVRAIDVSLGIYSNFGHVVRDGAIGLVAGVGVVALIGTGICRHDSNGYCSLNAAVIAIPVGVLGLVSGVVIARSHKKENWDRIYERSRTTSLLVGPTPGGVLVGLSIPFGSGAQR